jgi:hypothetical protein
MKLGKGCVPGDLFQPLEARALFSAPPTVTDIQFNPTIGRLNEPVRISALAQDDVGVRAVTFFMDRNANGRWDPYTDQPLGDDFVVDGDGRYSVTATPDASWPGYPDYAKIVADVVDTENLWATTRPTATLTFVGKPVITSITANITIFGEGGDNFMVIDIRAKADEPFVYPYGINAVTFFLDKNFNARWDSGVDVDFGVADEVDSNGYSLKSTTYGQTTLDGQLVAAARSSAPINDFWGPTAVARVVRTSTTFQPVYPVVLHATYENLDRPAEAGVATGERMRIEFVSGLDDRLVGGRSLAATTLFFDANYDRIWSPGTDIDIGAFFFGADILRGRGHIDFTVTPAMNFDYRAFCLATKDSNGAWGPTYTVFPKIVSKPWVEGLSNDPVDVPSNGSVTLNFTARDDHAIRQTFGFIDKNNNGTFDAGEASMTGGARVTFGPRNQQWRLTINLSGLGYTPGQYRIGVLAHDYEGVQSNNYTFITVNVV